MTPEVQDLVRRLRDLGTDLDLEVAAALEALSASRAAPTDEEVETAAREAYEEFIKTRRPGSLKWAELHNDIREFWRWLAMHFAGRCGKGVDSAETLHAAWARGMQEAVKIAENHRDEWEELDEAREAEACADIAAAIRSAIAARRPDDNREPRS